MKPCDKPDSSNGTVDDSGSVSPIEKNYIRFHDSGKEPDVSPLFTIREYSSSMDLAWRFITDGCFPSWASVLVSRQRNGRGQFRREWVSPDGNMYGSIRMPLLSGRHAGIIPLLTAGCVLDALNSFGISGEFKWPNDILAGRKKVGGILIEERTDIIVAGIGLNIVSAPGLGGMRDDSPVEAGCLKEFGIDCSPLDLWTRIVRSIHKGIPHQSSDDNVRDSVRYVEERMAFIGENVVFDSHDGKVFPAVVLGLDNSGGIRLRTANGEMTRYSGSVCPKVC